MQTLSAHPDIDVVGSPERRELECLQFARRCFWLSEVGTYSAHGAHPHADTRTRREPRPRPTHGPDLSPGPVDAQAYTDDRPDARTCTLTLLQLPW